MRRDDALAELPTAHAVALRLVDAGADAATIATALAVPVESVAGLVELAQAKLAAILDSAASDEVVDLRTELRVREQ